VVKAVPLPAREQDDGPKANLEHDRRLGEAQRIPEADRWLVTKPGHAAPAPGDQVRGDDRDPHRYVNREHRLRPPRGTTSPGSPRSGAISARKRRKSAC